MAWLHPSALQRTSGQCMIHFDSQKEEMKYVL